MRRVVGDDEDGVARVQTDRDVDALARGGVDAPEQRQRPVGPLVLLDAAVVDRLEEREVVRVLLGVDRPGLQVDVGAVVVRANRAGAGDDRFGADDDEDDGAVPAVDEEPRPGLDGRAVGQLREPGRPGETEDLRRRSERRARHLEVPLVLFGEAKNGVAVSRRDPQPRRLAPFPHAARRTGLRREKPRHRQQRQPHADADPHARFPSPARAAVHAVIPPTTLLSLRNPLRSSTLVATEER